MLPDLSEGHRVLQVAGWVLASGVLGSRAHRERQRYARHFDLIFILQILLSHNVRAVDEQRLYAPRRADGIGQASASDRCRRFWGKPAG